MVEVEVTFRDFVFARDDLDEAPVVKLFTDQPALGETKLPYADAAFGSVGVRVVIPSFGAWTRIYAQCVALTRNDDDNTVSTLCGRAEFSPTGGERDLVSPEANDRVHGRLSLRVLTSSDAADEKGGVADPDLAASARALGERTAWWYHRSRGVAGLLTGAWRARPGYEPLQPDLEKMHLQWLDFPESGIPCFFFMYHEPRFQDSETTMASGLAAAGARMGWNPRRVAQLAYTAIAEVTGRRKRAVPSDDTVRFAILVAEMLQALPNSMPYLEDIDEANTRGRPYSDSRREVCTPSQPPTAARSFFKEAASPHFFMQSPRQRPGGLDFPSPRLPLTS